MPPPSDTRNPNSLGFSYILRGVSIYVFDDLVWCAIRHPGCSARRIGHHNGRRDGRDPRPGSVRKNGDSGRLPHGMLLFRAFLCALFPTDSALSTTTSVTTLAPTPTQTTNSTTPTTGSVASTTAVPSATGPLFTHVTAPGTYVTTELVIHLRFESEVPELGSDEFRDTSLAILNDPRGSATVVQPVFKTSRNGSPWAPRAVKTGSSVRGSARRSGGGTFSTQPTGWKQTV